MDAWAPRAKRRRRSRGPRAGATPPARRAAAAAGRRGARAPRSDPPPGLTYINYKRKKSLGKVRKYIEEQVVGER